eukprot:TRINITY_DN2918_c0_g1_i1.p1 TRINITY_DN2918_c0_g1~~TRINITY_DN2918_c0_g1_i1.p1  ORF type:complete len:832 (-),score=205.17 TRINITY_DN2918_c0_g1_i1:39-2534(-)
MAHLLADIPAQLKLLVSERLLDRERAVRNIERALAGEKDDVELREKVSLLRETVRAALQEAITRGSTCTPTVSAADSSGSTQDSFHSSSEGAGAALPPGLAVVSSSPVACSPIAAALPSAGAVRSEGEDGQQLVPWETMHGVLMLASVLSRDWGRTSGPGDDGGDVDDCEMFREFLLESCDALMEHPEPRIRFGIADVLGSLSHTFGATVFQIMKEKVLHCVDKHFSRDASDASAKLKECPDTERLEEKKDETAAVMHDTEGWKCLETALACLQRMIEDAVPSAAPPPSTSPFTSSPFPAPAVSEASPPTATAATKTPVAAATASAAAGGAAKEASTEAVPSAQRTQQHVLTSAAGVGLRDDEGRSIGDLVDDRTLAVVSGCVTHTNRFVREKSFFTYAAICAACRDDAEFFRTFADRLAQQLAVGLGDNWSQVRYAASVAVRSFFLTAKKHLLERQYFPLLIPRMCLNRYYVAEGVKLYSHESWRLVTGTNGKALLEECIDETVKYYCMQSEADNHAVREAACHCIAEMGAKLNPDRVRPHIPQLHQALMVCFRDASWPVRDAACTASGRFVRSFPEESLACIDELYELWFAHLSDNIWSVREDSAIALGDVLYAYKEKALDRIVAQLDILLPQAKEQPEDSHLRTNLENTTTFGVAAKKSRANDPSLHTDQQVFSCGSLAPKLKRGAGCMDHGFARHKEPWESTDGGIYLLREVARQYPATAVKYLPLLAEIADLRHFAHYHMLQDTLWKQLPVILTSIAEKEAGDLCLAQFVAPLLKTLDGDNRLAMNAASLAYLCMRKIADERSVQLFTSEQRAKAEENKFVKRNGR